MTQEVMIMLGAPASGKGTQARMIAEEFDFVHISTGKIFREEIEKGTELGREAEKTINDGHLVSDESTIKMVEHFMDSHQDDERILLDGFPRTKDQSKWLLNYLEEHKIKTKVIYLDVNEEALINRIEERAKIEGREDDKPEVFKKRLAIYDNSKDVILEYFGDNKITIDGDQTIEEVSQEIRDKLK